VRERRTPASRGVIGLLYRDADGVWQVVDIKADSVADDVELQSLVGGGYGGQMRRYREAVQGLLGRRVESTLCFLDEAGHVRWLPVVPVPAQGIGRGYLALE
jgi:hypothetical protein